MKVSNKFFIVAIATILCSCNNHYNIANRNDLQAIDTIDFSNGLNLNNNLKLSHIAESINYYPIPTNDNYLIGKMNKLMVTDSMFIILDKDITRAVYLHTKNGERTYCIHKHGNGPEEYINLSDVSYNNKTQEIGIHCNIKKKILYYSLNGNFLRGEDVLYTAYAAQPIGDNILLHTEFKEHPELEKDGKYPNLILLNRKDSQESLYHDYFSGPINRAVIWSSNCWISQWEDTLGIKPDHCNIVYHCTNNAIYPAHFIDFGKHNIDDSYWNIAQNPQITRKEMELFYETTDMYEILQYLESEKYIYFAAKHHDKTYMILYSKISKQKIAFESIEDDLELYSSFYPKAIHGNKLYFTLKAHYLPIMRGHKKSAANKHILDMVDEQDNPIIIELTLKDF